MGEPSVRQKNSRVFCCDFPPLLKDERAQIAQGRMPALPIIKHLQVLKQRLSCFCMRLVEGSMDTLVFERAKKGCGGGIIVTIAFPTHTYDDLRLLQHLVIGMTSVLAAS